MSTHRRRWNQKEKDAAAEGVRRFGAFNHRRIAQLVGTRSRAQVRTYLYAAGYRKLGAGYTTVAAAAREAESETFQPGRRLRGLTGAVSLATAAELRQDRRARSPGHRP